MTAAFASLRPLAQAFFAPTRAQKSALPCAQMPPYPLASRTTYPQRNAKKPNCQLKSNLTYPQFNKTKILEKCQNVSKCLTKSERARYTTFSEKSLNFYPQRGENMKKVKSKLSTFMQNFVAMGLLMLLTLLLCFTTSPFEKSQPKTVDAVSIIPDSTTMYEWQQDDRGWYTYLGTYPQTYVGDELNSELVALLNYDNLTPTGNTYISNNRASEMTSYEEKQNKEYEYDGKLYVAVENQQLYDTNYTFSTGEGVGNTGAIKFFKVEPIKWYIIDGTDPESAPAGTQCKVISDLVLNAMPFDDGNSNVWQDSLIREYLNNAFYNEIELNDLECIIWQHNQNGSRTNYNGPDTDDYVYFLSYQEMNGQYEFLDTNAERITKPTDFALSNCAAYRNAAAYYWLRTTGSYSNSVYTVGFDGSLSGSDDGAVHVGIVGVRPALTLDLDSMPEPGGVEPIYISTADELKQLSDYSAAGGIFNPNWKFYLDSDIDMSSVPNFAIGGLDNPFTGYFNGQGHTISNLNFNMSSATAGMFACVCDCTIINLNLADNRVIEISGSNYFSPLIATCIGEVFISNVNVNYNKLIVKETGAAGLISYPGVDIGIDKPLVITITDCEVIISQFEGLQLGGIIGVLNPESNRSYNQISISRCMVLVGECNADFEGNPGGGVFAGVCAVLLENRSGYPTNVNLNQIYIDLGNVIFPSVGGTLCFGGLFNITYGLYGALTYNEVACRANISCDNPSLVETGYEWAMPPDHPEVCSVFGTNSYFNITGVTADFSGTGRYAGVFDVARKQYYSGFSDNQWLIFPTDKHPTLREFMAIGDFAPIASVEDKLIELGYTKIM